MLDAIRDPSCRPKPWQANELGLKKLLIQPPVPVCFCINSASSRGLTSCDLETAEPARSRHGFRLMRDGSGGVSGELRGWSARIGHVIYPEIPHRTSLALLICLIGGYSALHQLLGNVFLTYAELGDACFYIILAHLLIRLANDSSA